LDVRLERRSLAPNEFAALLEATRQRPDSFGLSGSDREMLYLVAANTGFRASELASLLPESFQLEPPKKKTDPPLAVRIKAAYAKNRKEVDQPLRPDLAARIGEWMAGKPADRPLWPAWNIGGGIVRKWWKDAAEMIKADLEAAGLAYHDVDGRVFDFHALRHLFISNLCHAGVHPKEAQILARHSTITLTMDRYTHLGIADAAAALDKLPALPTR